MKLSDHDIRQLRRQCHTVLTGHRQHDAAQDYAAMAAYCSEHHIEHDSYGEGNFVQNFEHKIATLIGFEAGVFSITGTLTQSVALRLACMERGSSLVGLHASAHVLKHENSNYQLLDTFKVIQFGDPHRPWTIRDLEPVHDRLAAVLLELPMREIGGQLPGWDELQDIKQYCREKHIHLHLDGARLWEAQAAYDRSFVEITNGFNSVYVSFYKGINALSGAMLLGPREFVDRARTWMHRQGGSVFRRSPYVISAAMQLDQRLCAMPACFTRAKELAAIIRQFPTLQMNPATPQCNLFHLYLPVDAKCAIEIRNQIAQQHGVWLFNNATNSALPDQSYSEWYVGDNMLEISDQQVMAALSLLADECARRH